MKIIYLCDHYCSSLISMLHKIEYHNEDDAIILQNEADINSSKLFNIKIIKYGVDISEQNYNNLLKQIDLILIYNKINLKDFDKIYVAYDLKNYYIFKLLNENLNFSIIESRFGHLRTLLGLPKSKFPHSSITDYFNALKAQHSCVSEIFCWTGSKDEYLNIFKNVKKISEFDPAKTFYNLYNTNRSEIEYIYNLKLNDYKTRNNTLFLLNSEQLTCSLIKRFNNQFYLLNNDIFSNNFCAKIASLFYLVFLDYFIENPKRIDIKFHPSVTANQKEYFTELNVTEDSTIPAQFLGLCYTNIICPGKSTTLAYYKYFNKKIISLGFGIFESYQYFFFISLVFKIYQKLCKNNDLLSLYFINISKNIIRAILLYNNQWTIIKKEKLKFLNSTLDDSNIFDNSNSICCIFKEFLSTVDVVNFYNKYTSINKVILLKSNIEDYINNIKIDIKYVKINIHIKEISSNNDSITIFNDTSCYLISSDNELLNMFLNFKDIQKLYYSKLLINFESIDYNLS